jgi:hypothetical protein
VYSELLEVEAIIISNDNLLLAQLEDDQKGEQKNTPTMRPTQNGYTMRLLCQSIVDLEQQNRIWEYVHKSRISQMSTFYHFLRLSRWYFPQVTKSTERID